MTRALPVLAILLAVGSADVRAQSLREQCAAAASGTLQSCEALADAALMMPQRTAIAAAGGNPVPGTASTIGMRVPGSPRWSVALRSTAARASLPPFGSNEAERPVLWGVHVDASAGVFNGFNLLPTIGGFASLDVIASAGVLGAAGADDFELSSPLTWGLGARVGILRESFTAPGVSISAMYRSLPDVELGEPGTGPYFENAGQNVISLRGTVGKRVLGIGLTGGIGYDRVGADLGAQYAEPGPTLPRPVIVEEDDVTSSRTSFFGNITYTLLILNMAAELGWQEDGDRPSGAHRDAGRGGLFGGIAFRLAI